MAVRDRGFKAYTGLLTPEWSRFLVLPRYSFREVFRSRLFTGFFFICFVWPFAMSMLVYLRHNATALQAFEIQLSDVLAIDASFFRMVLEVQAWQGFVVALVVGPALVAPDLRHNGLPLYLCRPFSRTEYVLGKFSVLFILLSSFTWVAVLLIFGLQAYLEGFTWLFDHLQIAFGLALGGVAWVTVFALLALALSAWVKWKTLAQFLFLLVFFVAAGFGAIVNELFNVRWGSLLNLRMLFDAFWSALMGISEPGQLSGLVAALLLATLAGFCLLILWRRLRAYEVVT